MFSQNFQSKCGTPDPSQEEIEAVQQRIQPYYDTNSRTPDDDPLNIKVAWHVITSSTVEGDLTDSVLASWIENEYNRDAALKAFCDYKATYLLTGADPDRKFEAGPFTRE